MGTVGFIVIDDIQNKPVTEMVDAEYIGKPKIDWRDEILAYILDSETLDDRLAALIYMYLVFA